MRDGSRSLLNVAHRGASAYRPEHTFEAYDLAIALGSDVLELDLRLSADGEPVVLHDRTLWRTALDPRSVNTLTLAELRELDAAVRPLTLREVLGRYGSETRYLLDVKEPRGPLVDRVIDVAVEAGIRGRIQLQCFSRAGLVRAHRRTPWLSLAQLYQPMVPRRAMLRDLPRISSVVDTIGPEAASVDDDLVAAAHAAGLRVQPYTANDPSTIRRLLASRVDGIITDTPDRVRDAIRGLPGREAQSGSRASITEATQAD